MSFILRYCLHKTNFVISMTKQKSRTCYVIIKKCLDQSFFLSLLFSPVTSSWTNFIGNLLAIGYIFSYLKAFLCCNFALHWKDKSVMTGKICRNMRKFLYITEFRSVIIMMYSKCTQTT